MTSSWPLEEALMKDHAPSMFAVLGSFLAWDEASLRDRVVWIGAHLSVEDFGISVAIPKDKLDAMHGQTTRFLSATVAQKKDLRSFCGKLSFVAGMVPTLRPFIDKVWAALASSSRLLLELVHCPRFRALWWLQALPRGSPSTCQDLPGIVSPRGERYCL